MKQDKQIRKIVLKSYTKGDLAQIYDVSPKVFAKWIKPFEEQIGVINGRYYNVNQVSIIFKLLGMPSTEVEYD